MDSIPASLTLVCAMLFLRPAIAAMLDPFMGIPVVPAQGTGGAGEILPLGHLFYNLSEKLTMEPKERMAVINGSPCAA